MKRKIYAIILGLVMLFSLNACSKEKEKITSQPQNTPISNSDSILEKETKVNTPTEQGDIDKNIEDVGEESSVQEEPVNNIEPTAKPIIEDEPEEQETIKGYYPTINQVHIGVNLLADPIIEKLGEYDNCFESESCGFKGIDKIYYYPGFEITTYPYNSKDYINDIYIDEPGYPTNEGIEVGSSKEDMLRVYGDQYVEEFDIYTYTKENSIMKLSIMEDEVFAIEFLAIPPKDALVNP